MIIEFLNEERLPLPKMLILKSLPLSTKFVKPREYKEDKKNFFSSSGKFKEILLTEVIGTKNSLVAVSLKSKTFKILIPSKGLVNLMKKFFLPIT